MKNIILILLLVFVQYKTGFLVSYDANRFERTETHYVLYKDSREVEKINLEDILYVSFNKTEWYKY